MSPRRDYARRAAARATGSSPAKGRDNSKEPAASVVHLAAPAGARPLADSATGTGTGSGAETGIRWGLVLGGGGVLGAAWLIGALDALEKSRGLDAREAEMIVGTSAGSIIGALLASGVSVEEQRAQQLGDTPTSERVAAADFDAARPAGPSRPLRPRLRPGSPAIIRNNRGSLRELPRTALLAGLAPAGRGRLTAVNRLIEAVVPAGEWPDHAGFRAVVLDYETGRRVVFGEPGAPAAGLSEAVLASCAIPGWFEPVTIGGRRYVDGGMWSITNADLLADAGLDEVFVLAPMASAAYDAPSDWRARVERRIRVKNTQRCLSEARAVQVGGTDVTVIGPGPEELSLMGYNLMHPGRRAVVLESARRTVTAALAQAPQTQAAQTPAPQTPAPQTQAVQTPAAQAETQTVQPHRVLDLDIHQDTHQDTSDEADRG